MDPMMDPAAWPSATPPPPPIFPVPGGNHNSHPQFPEPPYPDLIIGAITSLKEKEGSSRQAIDRYIQSVYTSNLPSNHSTLLSYHLKTMKTNGALEMVKHSYALPGSVPIPVPLAQSPPPAAKRRPGRPPKTPTVPSAPFSGPQLDAPVDPSETLSDPQPNAETMFVSLGLADGPGSAASPLKRGRGRPPGSKSEPKSATEGGSVEKKPRGRPPRPVRGEGRPARVVQQKFQQQVVVGEKKRGRGRPPSVNKKAVTPGGSTGKPRGRPKKVVVMSGDGGGGTVAVPSGRPRGRPSGSANKKARRVSVSGKPLGRPRKSSLTPATQVAAQHLVAYQDLKHKMEHFQSRVKQAVDLVRPYFTSESAPYAYGALQELEQLANTDMTAPPPQTPPQAAPQAPPQAPPQVQWE